MTMSALPLLFFQVFVLFLQPLRVLAPFITTAGKQRARVGILLRIAVAPGVIAGFAHLSVGVIPERWGNREDECIRWKCEGKDRECEEEYRRREHGRD
ncbi:hypothetical protein chiPu_0016151 [Chiloscyllium punctatum]|uniref:Uncharacterized protein n=1 Tax=Chiloscyllium punctatum TaxID=137246 RepID=A0A401T4Q0_CHIPU|nr:hypothetical protein [Chiloscyllium punctatum]